MFSFNLSCLNFFPQLKLYTKAFRFFPPSRRRRFPVYFYFCPLSQKKISQLNANEFARSCEFELLPRLLIASLRSIPKCTHACKRAALNKEMTKKDLISLNAMCILSIPNHLHLNSNFETKKTKRCYNLHVAQRDQIRNRIAIV